MKNSAPIYIYKIFPSTYGLREPLPERVPVSPGDQLSGFIHLLTALQVPNALKSSFKNDPMVYVLRLSYDRVMEDIRWEPADGALSETRPETELCPVGVDNRILLLLKQQYFSIPLWTYVS